MVVKAIKVTNLDVICKMSASVPIQAREAFDQDLIEAIESYLEVNEYNGVAELFYIYELSGEEIEEDVDVEWYVVDWKNLTTELYKALDVCLKGKAHMECMEKYKEIIKIIEP